MMIEIKRLLARKIDSLGREDINSYYYKLSKWKQMCKSSGVKWDNTDAIKLYCPMFD